MPLRRRLTNTDAISGRSTGATGFLFHDRREDQRLVRRRERQAGRARCSHAAASRSVIASCARAAATPGRCCRRRRNRCPGRTGPSAPCPGAPSRAISSASGRSSTVFLTSALVAQRALARRRTSSLRRSRATSASTSPCVSFAEQLRQRDPGVDLVAAGLDRAVHAAARGPARPAPAVAAARRLRRSSRATADSDAPGLHIELERRLRQRQRLRVASTTRSHASADRAEREWRRAMVRASASKRHDGMGRLRRRRCGGGPAAPASHGTGSGAL